MRSPPSTTIALQGKAP